MDNDEILEIEVKIECEKLASYQRDVDEFTKLGTRHSSLSYFVIGLMPLVIIVGANIIFTIDTLLFQLLCLFCVFFSIVVGLIKTEVENTNRRIDLLYKINKEDMSKNT